MGSNKLVIPKRIDVFGKKVKIKIVETLNDGGDDAEFCHETSEIRIVRRVVNDPELFWVAIIHEMIHAFADRMSWSVSGIHESLEEQISDTIGKFMSETFEMKFKKR